MFERMKVYLYVGIVFLICSVYDMFTGEKGMWILFIVTAIIAFYLSYREYKKNHPSMGPSDYKAKFIDLDEVLLDTTFIIYLGEGQTIKAIKRCRELSGVDLVTAKEFVEKQIN